MPSCVEDLLRSAGLTHTEVVDWGTRPNCDSPGIYMVALTPDPLAVAVLNEAPLDPQRIEQLLQARPELTVDGERPDADCLHARLARMWPANETVLYVGLASGSVSDRVVAYYRTRLGARTPHAGGWPIKTLSELDALYVHIAAAAEPSVAEEAVLDAFVSAVSTPDRERLVDPSLPLPFANLEDGRRRRKSHGIRGARAPQLRQQAPRPVPVAASVRSWPPTAAGQVAITVTAADVGRGQIRITRPAKRMLDLPERVEDLEVHIRGEVVTCSWDARLGPDKERSGLLRIGRERLARLMQGAAPTQLTFRVTSAGSIRLD